MGDVCGCVGDVRERRRARATEGGVRKALGAGERRGRAPAARTCGCGAERRGRPPGRARRVWMRARAPPGGAARGAAGALSATGVVQERYNSPANGTMKLESDTSITIK